MTFFKKAKLCLVFPYQLPWHITGTYIKQQKMHNSLNQYLLAISCMPGPVLGDQVTAES